MITTCVTDGCAVNYSPLMLWACCDITDGTATLRCSISARMFRAGVSATDAAGFVGRRLRRNDVSMEHAQNTGNHVEVYTHDRCAR